jgi:hypothetical protein
MVLVYMIHVVFGANLRTRVRLHLQPEQNHVIWHHYGSRRPYVDPTRCTQRKKQALSSFGTDKQIGGRCTRKRTTRK